MAKRSAGIVAYRSTGGEPEVLLVHPGGPFFARKDAGAWTIPKGEHAPGEDPRACALREFAEETGRELPEPELRDLGEITQRGGKVVRAWAVETDLDATAIRSNTFELEWPPRSGRIQEFPEVDRGEWFAIDEARRRILPAQEPLLDRLLQDLRG